MHTVFAGAFVMVCISLLGLILACCRPSCTRGLFTTVYLCAALPSWVTLVFVSVLSFAFKEKTHALVSEYWFCLEMYTATHKHGLTAATAADAGDALYKHTEMAAAFCVTSAVSLLFSMLCLCRTILWHAHACARQTVFYIAIWCAPRTSAPTASARLRTRRAARQLFRDRCERLPRVGNRSRRRALT